MADKNKPDKGKSPSAPARSGGLRDFFIGLVVGVFLTAGTGLYFVWGRKQPPVKRALAALNLRGEDIRQELVRTGKVVRRQAREFGTTMADATADARVTAGVKARLTMDPDLSAIAVSVNTTGGHVTLSGTVASHDQIGKAILLALETDGAREVTSTLQVKKR